MTTGLAAKLMVYGVIVAEQLLLTVLFFRFWRASREKLFAFFALGFFVMGVHRISLGFAVAGGVDLEQQTPVFLWRLVAYLLILAGVVTKNLQRRRAD
ncbi:MAG TPA: DUF5985 family protein [Thermoanaerobaculia bacterium]